MASITPRDESDYDSSSSSMTVPDSSRSWMSNLSFGSRRSSLSVTSYSNSESFTSNTRKPHKANQTAWEAIWRLKASASGGVGLDHFRLLRRLGSGDLGNVYLCQIRNPVVGLAQCFYAMKVVDKDALAIRKKLQRAEMEKDILGILDHPFLPTLYAHFDASHYSCLVMEYCPGGDLYAARLRQPGRRFSISSTKFYGAEILLAIEYLHMMGIVYRDLKPENVLLRQDGHIMLSDFDLSFKCDVVPELLTSSRAASKTHTRRRQNAAAATCFTPLHPVLSCFSGAGGNKNKLTTTTIVELSDHNSHYTPPKKELDDQFDRELVAEPMNARSKSFVGTHEYLAPEVISGQGHGGAVDWWTLGIFLYEMLYGETPFKGQNNEATLVNILKKPLTFPRNNRIVSNGKEIEEMVKIEDLIRKLLIKNPKKRIGGLKGSVEIKRHEFFKGVNWALIRSVKPPYVPNHVCNLLRGRSSTTSHIPNLTKKQREAPYQIPLSYHFDYF